jgi:hypothetical protein
MKLIHQQLNTLQALVSLKLSHRMWQLVVVKIFTKEKVDEFLVLNVRVFYRLFI